MTDEQAEFLENKFRIYEKNSSKLVLILFATILVVHMIDPFNSISQMYVKYVFRFSLILVLGFILMEFLKDLFFPLIAKFVFRDQAEK